MTHDPRARRITWKLARPEVDETLTELAGPPDDDGELARVRVLGARLTGSTWEGARLTDVVFDDCELSGVTLSSANLVRVQFNRCRMSGLIASDLKAKDVGFLDCTLPEAWFRMATMERCELIGCDLTGADLYAASLTHCHLLRCELAQAELSKATLIDVALHGSTLDGIRGAGSLRGLIIGSDQILPLAIPILSALDINVDDDHFDDPT